MNPTDTQKYLLHYVVICAAWVIIALGGVIATAWISHAMWMEGLLPGLFLMEFNTALAFIGIGIGLIAVLKGARRIALVVGGSVLFVSCITLLEYFTGIDLGIDEWWVKDFYGLSNSHPGRMPPNTALAFACAGLSIIWAEERWLHSWRIAAMELFAFFVFSLGAEGMLAQVQKVALAYSWDSYTRMGVTAAVGFMGLGVGLVALTWRLQWVCITRVPLLVPGLLCFIVLMVDIGAPHGIAEGIVYIPLVFCSLWFTRPQTVFVFAGIATVLTAIGFFIKVPSEALIWVVVVNRMLTVGVLWFTATLVYLRRKAEQLYKSGESRLRAVMDYALDGLISINERGIIEHFNPACERIFGYTSTEVVGQNIKMLMPEPYHGEHDGYLARYFATGKARIIGTAGREVTAKRKDGSVFPMDLSISAFELKDGRHFSGVVRDITARKEAEQEIKDSAVRLRAIFDNVLDGLITINSHAIVQSFNTSAERIFGYSAEEVVGQNVKMLMSEPYQSEYDCYVDNDLKTGEAKIVGTPGREVRGKRKNGSIFPMDLGISTFNTGKENAFIGIIRDITARKQAEENSAALLASIVASSYDAIISKTLEGVITSWNASAERMFGYSAEEAMGQHISLIVPQEKLEEEQHILDQLDKGEQVQHFRTVRINKDKQFIDISLTVSAVRDMAGRIIGVSKIIRDIGAQKKTEAELLQYTHALERSNKELDEFAYVASHDLKAPLRVIDNASKWLEEDLQEHLTAETRENMNLMRGRIGRMEKLLDDLLEYSRIGRSTDERYTEIITGNALMDNIIALCPPPEGFTIEVSPRFADIQVSRMPLQQVLMNLIGNAIKHHDKTTGCIEVTVEDNSSTYIFSVKDDGPGIPIQFHDQIFKMFQTLKPRDQVEGSGMGLAMVRKNLEILGGKINLESSEGKGSVFRFTWPKQ